MEKVNKAKFWCSEKWQPGDPDPAKAHSVVDDGTERFFDFLGEVPGQPSQPCWNPGPGWVVKKTDAEGSQEAGLHHAFPDRWAQLQSLCSQEAVRTGNHGEI